MLHACAVNAEGQCVFELGIGVLNVLFPIQYQSKQRAQKFLDVVAGNGFSNASLDILWSVMW